MSKLKGFFKEPHNPIGVFYPVHYLVAVFRDMPSAKTIEGSLLSAGFPATDVIVVEGEDFVELEKEETGLVGTLMQELSRFLGTEQISTDHNLDFAYRGAAFVIVHCPSDETRKSAWEAMEKEHPLAAHFYAPGGVDHLAGGFDTN